MNHLSFSNNALELSLRMERAGVLALSDSRVVNYLERPRMANIEVTVSIRAGHYVRDGDEGLALAG